MMLYKKRPPPATNRRDAAHNCEQGPLAPGDDWYVDLSPARGGGGAIRTIVDNLRDARDETYRKILFLSHRGAGKTTELRRLESTLAPQYRTIYIETDQELHSSQMETEALLLLAVLKVEVVMREASMPIDKELLDGVTQWFADVVRETEWGKTFGAEVEAGTEGEVSLLSFAKAFAKIKALFQYESTHRQVVTETLKKFPGMLVNNVNRVLDAAQLSLGPLGQRLLIVFDNLDRYATEVMDKVLVKRREMFKNLRADILLTPPVGLYYFPVTLPLSQCYDACEFMDTVALRRRNDGRDQTSGPGVDLLREAVAKRMDVHAIFEDPDDLQDLILATGGAVRELFNLIASACRRSAHETTTTHEAVVQAKKKLLSELRDRIYINGYENVLSTVASTKRVSNHQLMSRVMNERLVLKYNSDGWYDVFPLLWQDDELAENFRSSRSSETPST